MRIEKVINRYCGMVWVEVGNGLMVGRYTNQSSTTDGERENYVISNEGRKIVWPDLGIEIDLNGFCTHSLAGNAPEEYLSMRKEAWGNVCRATECLKNLAPVAKNWHSRGLGVTPEFIEEYTRLQPIPVVSRSTGLEMIGQIALLGWIDSNLQPTDPVWVIEHPKRILRATRDMMTIKEGFYDCALAAVSRNGFSALYRNLLLARERSFSDGYCDVRSDRDLADLFGCDRRTFSKYGVAA